MEWLEGSEITKFEETEKKHSEKGDGTQCQVKIENGAEGVENQEPSSSLDKKMRGPYRQYTEKLK